MILIVGVSPAAQRRMIFPRLARNQVNRASRVEDLPSGKPLNCARAAHRLGVPATTLLFLGGDTGRDMRLALEREGIPCRVVGTASPTRLCVTVMDESDGSVTELVENTAAVTPSEIKNFTAAFEEELGRSRALILIGTISPGTPVSLYRDFALQARHRGLPVVVDTQGEALLQCLEAHPLLAKPNRHELAAATGLDCRTDEGLAAAAEELHRRGAEWVAVTDGAEDVFLSHRTGLWRIAPPRVRAQNPIGSGDAAAAGIAAARLQGKTMPEAVCLGIACGAANAAGEGYGRLDPSQVENLRSQVRLHPLEKHPRP